MLAVPSMHDKTVAVLGLGRSGLSVCRALAESGARTWAWDDAYERRASAAAAGTPIVDLALCNWARVDRLVLSPGIAHRHPRPHRLVRRARAAGVEVVGDIELLAENQPKRRIAGITGTNGKSTTTALVGALLRGAGIGVQVGGNIGLPVLDLLPKPCDDIYVLELSSYQLELTEHLACAVAVILNLTPDHLDRHGGMAGYVQAKKRIFRNQGASDWAVVGVDDAHGHALVERAGARSPGGAGRGRPAARAWRLRHGRAAARRDRRARAARSPTCVRSRACAAPTTGRTQPPPTPRCARSAWRRRRPRRAWRALPASPIAWSRRAWSRASATSTTARRPIPKPRRGRSRASIGSTGSPAAGRRRAGSSRSGPSSIASATPT